MAKKRETPYYQPPFELERQLHNDRNQARANNWSGLAGELGMIDRDSPALLKSQKRLKRKLQKLLPKHPELRERGKW